MAKRAKCFWYHHHQHTTHTNMYTSGGRYEINTSMQMLSLWLASFMQITRLRCSTFTNAYGYRLALCILQVQHGYKVPSKLPFYICIYIVDGNDRCDMNWHSEDKYTLTHTHTKTNKQMSVSPDIVHCHLEEFRWVFC